LNDLLMMKFGGTSVGSADRIRIAAQLAAEEQKKRPVAIVVSAMSKITDLLLDTMRHAEAGDRPGMSRNRGRVDEDSRAGQRVRADCERHGAAQRAAAALGG
jgi:bifunctional aspartokinase / homoserine dehydrogenase 1